MREFIIYGANGYSGRLAAEHAAGLGLKPLLCGRNAAKLAAVSADTGSPCRAFDATFEAAARELRGCRVLLNCAGPFSRTALPLARACMANGTHYLDITGEIEVFEALAALDAEARSAGVMLMPGTGFDVVPTDCLAAFLKGELPDAQQLALAFLGTGGVSHGTAQTMIENIAEPGAVRVDGEIRREPTGRQVRRIDFGDRSALCMSIPWGDVSTAWHSTGIPNIVVFVAGNAQMVRGARVLRSVAPLLASRPAQALLKRMNARRGSGPSASERAAAASYVWGEAVNSAGRAVSATVTVPDGYSVTWKASLEIAKRCLAGAAQPGFKTPSMVFGTALLTDLFGSEYVLRSGYNDSPL